VLSRTQSAAGRPAMDPAEHPVKRGAEEQPVGAPAAKAAKAAKAGAPPLTVAEFKAQMAEGRAKARADHAEAKARANTPEARAQVMAGFLKARRMALDELKGPVKVVDGAAGVPDEAVLEDLITSFGEGDLDGLMRGGGRRDIMRHAIKQTKGAPTAIAACFYLHALRVVTGDAGCFSKEMDKEMDKDKRPLYGLISDMLPLVEFQDKYDDEDDDGGEKLRAAYKAETAKSAGSTVDAVFRALAPHRRMILEKFIKCYADTINNWEGEEDEEEEEEEEREEGPTVENALRGCVKLDLIGT
jgi:hypothetical protein